MARKPIYMESTEIPMEKTAAEICACLVGAGATSIQTNFKEGKIVGLNWSMKFGSNEVRFAMPARVDPVYKLLHARRGDYGSWKYEKADRDQAERVAWRQLLRWVQAQTAMVETGMVQSAEVFMPYMQQSDGRTMFEYFESTQLRIAAPGTKS